jgi:hypothetical protein
MQETGTFAPYAGIIKRNTVALSVHHEPHIHASTMTDIIESHLVQRRTHFEVFASHASTSFRKLQEWLHH